MSIASSISSQQRPVKMDSTPTLAMKPVLGEGREARWEAVKDIVSKHIVPLYGAQDKLLGKVARDPNYKCRLLYNGEAPVGILIFKRKLSQKEAEREVVDSLRIKIFCAWGPTEQGANYRQFLLNFVLDAAKDLSARSLSIKLARGDSVTTSFLVNEKFHRLQDASTGNGLDIYWRALSTGPQKRYREEEGKTEPNKKLKSSTGQEERGNSVQAANNNQNSHHLPPLPHAQGNAHPHQNRPFITVRRINPLNSQNGTSLPPLQRNNNEYGQRTERRLTSTTIQLKYLRLIQNGSKTIEGRINSGMFARLREGENIQFFCKEEKVLCRVVKITHHNSFAQMLEREGVQRCLPDVNSLERAIDIYDRIPTYVERARASGVVAIHLQKISL